MQNDRTESPTLPTQPEKLWYVEQAKDALTRNGTKLEPSERQAIGAMIEVLENAPVPASPSSTPTNNQEKSDV